MCCCAGPGLCAKQWHYLTSKWHLGTFLSFSMALKAAGFVVFPTWSLATLEEVVVGIRIFVASSPAFPPA